MWHSITRVPQFCIGLFTTLFLIVWFAAWVLNALKGTQFDLNSLRDMYLYLITQLNATHAINSIWNSPRNSMPDQAPDYPAKN